MEEVWALQSSAVTLSFPVQHQNFEESQEAMKQQLLQLSILLKALDPELCDFLGQSSHTRQIALSPEEKPPDGEAPVTSRLCFRICELI